MGLISFGPPGAPSPLVLSSSATRSIFLQVRPGRTGPAAGNRHPPYRGSDSESRARPVGKPMSSIPPFQIPDVAPRRNATLRAWITPEPGLHKNGHSFRGRNQSCQKYINSFMQIIGFCGVRRSTPPCPRHIEALVNRTCTPQLYSHSCAVQRPGPFVSGPERVPPPRHASRAKGRFTRGLVQEFDP
jgi:hypothetical protein